MCEVLEIVSLRIFTPDLLSGVEVSGFFRLKKFWLRFEPFVNECKRVE